MSIYMLESEGEDVIRVEDGQRERMIKGSGGHKWELTSKQEDHLLEEARENDFKKKEKGGKNGN